MKQCATCSFESDVLTPGGFCHDVNACEARRRARVAPPAPKAGRARLVVRQRDHYFKRVVTSHPDMIMCERCGGLHASGRVITHEHLELVPDVSEATVFAALEAEQLRIGWGAIIEPM